MRSSRRRSAGLRIALCDKTNQTVPSSGLGTPNNTSRRDSTARRHHVHPVTRRARVVSRHGRHRFEYAIASDEHLIAWLRRVTVHRATDALRRRPRTLHGAAEFEDWMSETPREEGSLPLASEIERLLLALPPAQRVVVLLRYQEDLLPGEIAETLQMPLATVKSHLQRALKLMRARAEDTLKEYTRHG